MNTYQLTYKTGETYTCVSDSAYQALDYMRNYLKDLIGTVPELLTIKHVK